MVTSVRMAPPLPLIFLLMIHEVSSADWGVSYSPSHICALKDSSVIIKCTYTYPTGYQIKKVFWTKTLVINNVEPPDLSEDPEYSQRLQYLGDKQQNCTIRLSHVTLKDSHMYYFRFITNITGGRWFGDPGVTLTVTDLQVESPERVTEGDSVRLTCKSSCTLTDRATFIWYRNSQPLTERRDRNNELLLQSVRREDAGRYSCAVHGHNHISPAVQLNVTYPPRNVSVLITGSGEIVSGDSVTLICSSDSNPPALNFSWFKENESSAVGSGQSFSALQSGRFYCQAHNQHGSQRSDAVTVTVKAATVTVKDRGRYDSHLKVCLSVILLVITVRSFRKLLWWALEWTQRPERALEWIRGLERAQGLEPVCTQPTHFLAEGSGVAAMTGRGSRMAGILRRGSGMTAILGQGFEAVHPCTNTPKMNIPLYENVTVQLSKCPALLIESQ
ncbi:Sialic acid-binding Ig-like lectin 14 [Anabarilius grahami]|uniref:B-cell receptor CD22 n=1 Tax=Anabarilius grahami TaxID=495550 RepID=A0A3N0YJS4_ANAGA|nr:Sialic acid-binding Ig-like lectin 14 [Anabarilius grahami]